MLFSYCYQIVFQRDSPDLFCHSRHLYCQIVRSEIYEIVPDGLMRNLCRVYCLRFHHLLGCLYIYTGFNIVIVLKLTTKEIKHLPFFMVGNHVALQYQRQFIQNLEYYLPETWLCLTKSLTNFLKMYCFGLHALCVALNPVYLDKMFQSQISVEKTILRACMRGRSCSARISCSSNYNILLTSIMTAVIYKGLVGMQAIQQTKDKIAKQHLI